MISHCGSSQGFHPLNSSPQILLVLNTLILFIEKQPLGTVTEDFNNDKIFPSGRTHSKHNRTKNPNGKKWLGNSDPLFLEMFSAWSSVAGPSCCCGAPVALWPALTCFPSKPNSEFIVFHQPKYPQICFFILIQWNGLCFQLLIATSCWIPEAGAKRTSKYPLSVFYFSLIIDSCLKGLKLVVCL